jgi:hypothetical protein
MDTDTVKVMDKDIDMGIINHFRNDASPALLAASQAGTGMKKTNDAGTGPLPEEGKAVRNFLVRYRESATMNAERCRR